MECLEFHCKYVILLIINSKTNFHRIDYVDKSASAKMITVTQHSFRVALLILATATADKFRLFSIVLNWLYQVRRGKYYFIKKSIHLIHQAPKTCFTLV